MSITRKQLKSFGASEYLAKQLTQGLQPIARQRSAYVYDIAQVIDAIRDKLDAPNVRKTTKAKLAQLEIEVSGLIEPSVSSQQLLDAIAEAAQANTRFEQTARKARKAAQELQTYKKERRLDFSTHNNIVVFKV